MFDTSSGETLQNNLVLPPAYVENVARKLIFFRGLGGIWKVGELCEALVDDVAGKMTYLKLSVRLALRVSFDNVLKFSVKYWMCHILVSTNQIHYKK